ncbi:hypothetical protein, partial [uncultured Duncaniella sp.]|uniref:hypothetical protein n=1 Tax=uncultured Duncaniella sp. TaxID=2768039 RepID=UPI00272B814C
IENFLRFQVQDKHNASSFSRMFSERVAPIRIQKYKKSVIWHSTITDFMEKAREFDPFGHAGLTPSGKIRLTPSGKIKMTPVDERGFFL